MRDGERTDGHLLIGHTHWDHIQGLPFFAPLFRPGNEWHIYGPRGLDTSIDQTLAGQMQYTYSTVQLLEFGATITYDNLLEGQFEIDDLLVTTRYLHHPALTLGYRLEADGATVVYSSDHEPNTRSIGADAFVEPDRQEAQHVAFLRNGDLVIHDAQYLDAEYPQKVGWGHSTVEYAIDVAHASGARRLALFHHEPTRTDDAVDELVAHAHAHANAIGFAGEVFAAAEGHTITLESFGAEPERPSSDTATREPALGDLPRSVLVGVQDQEIAEALHRAARTEGFHAHGCQDFD